MKVSSSVYRVRHFPRRTQTSDGSGNSRLPDLLVQEFCNYLVGLPRLREAEAANCARKVRVRSLWYTCREEKNLVFCFGALFNSTLNFTQSGWHILFSPDLHFQLAKRVSGQTHSLQLETATRTDLSLVVPALRCLLAKQATQCGHLTVALTLAAATWTLNEGTI